MNHTKRFHVCATFYIASSSIKLFINHEIHLCKMDNSVFFFLIFRVVYSLLTSLELLYQSLKKKTIIINRFCIPLLSVFINHYSTSINLPCLIFCINAVMQHVVFHGWLLLLSTMMWTLNFLNGSFAQRLVTSLWSYWEVWL